ncbi:MAG: flagellar basal body P-ring formation chaperone FlgA [Acidocella sp.]|nr:flagellar basal body P-ring formation chaperone FlgA [Acidocella sp.]
MTSRAVNLAALAALPLWLALAPSSRAAPKPKPEAQAAVVAAIRMAVRAAIPADATITVAPVPGAAYMPLCPVALAVSISGVAPFEQATVRCPALGWTVYGAVTVSLSQMAVVAAHPLTAGQKLAAPDVTLARIPVASIAGRQIFTDPAALLGATPLLGLATGDLITSAQIEEPVIVRAGQSAIVQVVSGSVSLAITATADATGRLGDQVLFTNPASGRRFSALITASGPVVDLP